MIDDWRVRRSWRSAACLAALALILLLACLASIAELFEHREPVKPQQWENVTSWLAGPAFVRPGWLFKSADYVSHEPSTAVARFPVRKAECAFRVFIVGGSFAMGFPYVYPSDARRTIGGIDSWAREQLAARYPSAQIELINAATCGGNSHKVLQVVEELLEYQPDLIVVISGNNEGTVLPDGPQPPPLCWAMGRGLDAALGRSPVAEQPLQDLHWWFERNLEQVADLAQERNVKLALATLPVNLRYNKPTDRYRLPAGSQPSDLARALYARGRFAEAAELLAPHPGGESLYLIGRCHESMGRYSAAREAYAEAVEYQRFNRISPTQNRIVRAVAQRHGLMLIDMERAINERAPHGIPGDELFDWSCHLHWYGYCDLGLLLVDQIVAAGLVRPAPSEPLPGPSREELRQRVGLDDQYLARFNLPR
ncbi:MAG: tetratricopeptide repeat protein [Candidatus Alcyoniella australis]|nr:tetratricopeptide repeat protein [Candidatus Alcyoniella australis]